MKFEFLHVSPQRTRQVVTEIAAGSEPGARFYFLVGCSTLIAALGLVANSPAVVIGAMLVAPLMTPIFGISLALVRGDGVLLRSAIFAECVGIVISVGTGLLFGSLPWVLEITPEMLARTRPNLFDLMVAVLAGSAGSYALVDESLSPALPGVAIATAIVPPLANTGLCIALGAYHGALGSFLLFVANFLSILVVSSAVFLMAKMNYHFDPADKKQFFRKFGVAITGFLIVGVLLTHSLVRMVEEQNLTQKIESVLQREVSTKFAAQLNRFRHNWANEKHYVLAEISGPDVFLPGEIKRMETALAGELKEPVELIVRNTFVKDMGATGSTALVELQNLDGFFLGNGTGSKSKIIRETEQLLWEMLSDDPQTRLQKVNYGRTASGPIVLLTLLGHSPGPEEIDQVQVMLRKRFEMPDLNLIAEVVEPKLLSSHGEFLFGWSRYGKLSPDKEKRMQTIKGSVSGAFSKMPDLFPGEVFFHFREDSEPLKILIEVGGGRIPTREDRQQVEESLRKTDTLPLEVSFWMKPDTLLTKQGYAPFEKTIRNNLREHSKEIKEMWNQIE